MTIPSSILPIILLSLAGACSVNIGGGAAADSGMAADGGVPEADSDVPDEFPNPGVCPGGDAAFASILAEAEGIVTQANAPGVAIAVVCGGKLAHAAGIGNVKAGGSAVNGDTHFQLASSTKMFTAAAAARLASQGVVDLDTPIGDHIAGLGFGHLTLRELLSHSSGFPTVLDSYQGSTLEALAQANQGIALWSEPGAVWNYSNTGFLVAGAVLEAATGKTFDAIIQEQVFSPANMLAATMSTADVLAGGNYAYGHEGPAGSQEIFDPNGSYYGSLSYGPMGGAWSSVNDMAHWAEAHFAQDDPLGEGVMPLLRRKQIRTTSSGQGYGLGLFVEDSTPVMAHHGGNVTGFTAHFTMMPFVGFAVVVLSHGGGGISDDGAWLNPDDIANLAIDAYVPELTFADPVASPTNAELIGTYNDPSVFGKVIVREVGSGLEAEFVDKGFTKPLSPWYGDTYGVDFPPEGMIDFSFWREPGENASHIVSLYGVAIRE